VNDPSTLAAPAANCLIRNDWICGTYLRTRAGDLASAVGEHVELTVLSVLLGLLLAFPLALLARRVRVLQTPVLGVATVLYTIPSLAMFSLLLPVFGLSASGIVAAMAMYSLTVLVRNILAGLDGVPEEVREAARGLGYGPARLLFSVELPLALPALMAGLRIATVSTVSLVTVGGIIDHGGLGNLIYDGMSSDFKAEVLTASVLCVVIAVAADLLLLTVQRVLAPWRRAVAG
jgi:osmoprotectant transport system permease protein